eukprot:3101009-Amphidinium_carterae.1
MQDTPETFMAQKPSRRCVSIPVHACNSSCRIITLSDSCRNKSPIGTPATMAPEVWDGVITPEVHHSSLRSCFLQVELLKANHTCWTNKDEH